MIGLNVLVFEKKNKITLVTTRNFLAKFGESG